MSYSVTCSWMSIWNISNNTVIISTVSIFDVFLQDVLHLWWNTGTWIQMKCKQESRGNPKTCTANERCGVPQHSAHHSLSHLEPGKRISRLPSTIPQESQAVWSKTLVCAHPASLSPCPLIELDLLIRMCGKGIMNTPAKRIKDVDWGRGCEARHEHFALSIVCTAGRKWIISSQFGAVIHHSQFPAHLEGFKDPRMGSSYKAVTAASLSNWIIVNKNIKI